MNQLASRLREWRERAAGLNRLDAISQLGPPISTDALDAYTQLAEQPSQCGSGPSEPPDLSTGIGCAKCDLRLGEALPEAAVDDCLGSIDDAIRRQMNRLASAGVRQALARGNDPRIDRFLRVVQAAQISSLVEVLDDELTGFLRRFLIEARGRPDPRATIHGRRPRRRTRPRQRARCVSATRGSHGTGV